MLHFIGEQLSGSALIYPVITCPCPGYVGVYLVIP